MNYLIAGTSLLCVGALGAGPAVAEDGVPLPVESSTAPAPLSAPLDIGAEQVGSSVEVTWSASAGATSYQVVADPTGQTCVSATTSCLFDGLPLRQSYTFTVTASDGTQTSPASLPSEPLRLRALLEKPIFKKSKVVVGRSLRGRKIWAVRQGNPLAVSVLLSVGQMHGSEPAGLKVTKRIRKKDIPDDADYQLWTIRTMNPDGSIRRNRYNARGVDLNRNFPGTWANRYRTGRRAASEPETRAMMRFMKKLQPSGVMSFHQPWNTTLSVCDRRSAAWVRATASLMKLNQPGRATNCGSWLPGTMNRWTVRNTASWFVTVELGPNYKVRPQIPRAAKAVVRIAQRLAIQDQGL
ncbi:MAG: M14 family zinc carboxypeptidase [Candidatus Nanopelagicales bacterium]